MAADQQAWDDWFECRSEIGHAFGIASNQLKNALIQVKGLKDNIMDVTARKNAMRVVCNQHPTCTIEAFESGIAKLLALQAYLEANGF